MYADYEGSDTGLVGTVAVTILNADGSSYAVRTTAGITEPIAGSRAYHVVDPDPNLTLTLYWDEGVGTVCAVETLYAGRGIAPEAVDLAGVLAAIAVVQLKTNTLGALAVTVTSPVAASGTITIEQGDSYPAGRSRAIDVNVDDVTHAKGLDAENTTLYLLATKFTWTASSVTETVPGYLVRFEPTIADTAAVRDGGRYKLKACIDQVAPTDDDAETIQRGRFVLNRDIPAVDAP